jgi:hypothetical protein
MAIPSVGGGFQVGIGSTETQLYPQGAPATFTTSATVTAANLLTGIVVCDRGADAATALTLPTCANLDAAIANARADASFDFTVINIGDGADEDVTVTTNTGWTLVGLMVVQNLTSRTYRARKTGTAAWTLYALS